MKQVSAEAHPLDRRSGTGRGKEESKKGAGKGNWGTYKDDNKEVEETPVEAVTEEEVKEEKPEDKELTLEEYLAQK